ncbi:MAG: DNA ligase [Planctomycetes bacterium]|nr:DNA ligase [Planctomycetota bacterium]
MLAKRGPAFDSPDHLCEIKWEGIRVLAHRERDGIRAYTRNRNSVVERYPELDALRAAAPGLVLDGEIVALRDDRPDFESVLRREQARDPARIRALVTEIPVTYVVFDLVYAGFDSLCDLRLDARRERLAELVESIGDPRIVLSEAIAEFGKAMFEGACDRGLEGVVAKRRDSTYTPGRRSDAWIKIKRSQHLHCAIVGMIPAEDGSRDFKSLVVASDAPDGELRVVGRVGSGIRSEDRARLNEELWKRLRAAPLVPSDLDAVWVEPGVYCEVSFLEWTQGGSLRAPVFERLHSGA